MNQNGSGAQILSDQERMEDLLTQEKFLISAYGTFIPEASCPQLRCVLTDNFNGCVENQFTVFEKMNQLGWYQTKDAPMPEINEARQKFQQMQTQL